jgi:hypothetical protein
LVTVGDQLLALELAGWTKTTKAGDKFISLSCEVKSLTANPDMDEALPR